MPIRKRVLIGCGTLAVGLGIAAWIGVYTPPVVRPAHDPNWLLAGTQYPLGTSVVATTTEDGRTLRGIFTPADAGCPLVVHFAGAGISVTASPLQRFEFRELAIAGFASLALDYRGVGLSEGTVDSSALAVDAHAMYDEALRRVEGDPRRLVLRGASLGTIAIAAILESRRTARSVLMFAPVFADSVAVRYGTATGHPLLASVVRPFLRSLPAPPLPTALATYDGGLFVCSDPQDELLDVAEYRAITSLVRARGGTIIALSEPTDGDPFLDGLAVSLRHHVRGGIKATHVSQAERRFLTEQFPSQPPTAPRAAAVLAAGDPKLAAKVRGNPAALARLHELVGQVLGPNPNSLLAIAAAMPSSNSGQLLLQSRNHRPKSWLDTRSPEELEQLLDRSDPAGPIPAPAMASAAMAIDGLRDELEHIGVKKQAWPVQRALGFARAVLAEVDDETVFRESIPTEHIGRDWRFFEASQDPGLVHAEWRDEHGRQNRSTNVKWLREALSVLPRTSRRRLLIRILCKVVGVTERVDRAPNQAPIQLVRIDQKWREVDCERLRLR